MFEDESISPTKASYIDEIMKEKKDLIYDDLKDKSIEELTEIKNKKEEVKVEEKKEETKKEEPKTNTNINKNTNTNTNIGTSYTCTPPSDLKSTEWCQWNVKRPQSCEYSYPQKKNWNDLELIAFATAGVNVNEQLGSEGTNVVHSGASYCEAYRKTILTKEAIYIVDLDSVTGEVYSSTKSAISTNYSEEQVKQMGLAFWNLKEEECDNVWVVLGLNGMTQSIKLKYQVNMYKDGKNYSIDYDADTGAVLSSKSW